EEFEKVVRLKQNTLGETKRVQQHCQEIMAELHRKRFEHILEFVQSLGDLRAARGDIISLRELRYIDGGLVDKLEEDVAENAEKLAQRCVEFLLRDDSLAPYVAKVAEQRGRIDGLEKVSEAKELEEEIASSAGELEMLIDIVSNLKIDDATQRTAIIDSISGIFAGVNQARSALKNKTKELASVEGVAEFNSQLKLLNQSVVNYLDVCDSPTKCEEFLTKMMVQLEELEGRFAEFDEFVVQLTDKREEIYNAFESRKLALVEARNKRATSLMSAANRILKGIKTRVDNMESINDINGYFASDLMIEKVRDLCEELKELDDSVKVDDIQSRMKSVREDAVRQLKDRQDLFVGGENVIKFGNHQFNVNVQALDLTMVLRDGEMNLHLTGTNLFEPIENEELISLREVWDQEVVSENKSVYRAEYLAYLMLRAVRGDEFDQSAAQILKLTPDERVAMVQRFMGPRYSEAYVKGVSDHDAALLLGSLLEMDQTIGMLRYHARARAIAAAFWNWFADPEWRELMGARLRGLGRITDLFPDARERQKYIDSIRAAIGDYNAQSKMFDDEFIDEAATYLCHELSDRDHFTVSRNAATLRDEFQGHLKHAGHAEAFAHSVAEVREDAASWFTLVRDWASAFIERREAREDDLDYVDELAVLLMREQVDVGHIVDGDVAKAIGGMSGAHGVIEGGQYQLHFNHFLQKLHEYERVTAPRFQRYIELKKEIVEEGRQGMRLDEFRPRVLTSFVRNKLIDSVYLPLVGDNLAKQMGVAGEQKRTDLMGLLLLISPPGYGKTTLMEYIANRLGLIFMKINGPAIGHHVTSLDPVEAPNAGAREEVMKLNLSLEMGDNVMIYLDDIQHCNPEFLQKFISLCDAQRKIEGVYKGKTRTYDLRGRKVAVVMAGNPYTESGEKFQIPDMLSNRADIYNLGEIIGDSADAFEMSYLENSLTSNPALNKLASRSQQDVYGVIQIAERDSREGVDLEGNYSLEEVDEFVRVMKKLFRVRDVVLRVNRQYIESAAQADEYRTEPPFLLQGSYRNMNRIAEKVVPIMNDEELESLILSNYENDAQTLTSNTESNLLKLREMLSILTKEEERRWEDIRRTFSQNVKLKGVGADDQFGQVIVQLSSFSDGLDSLRRAVADGVERLAEQDDEGKSVEVVVGELSGLREGLTAIKGALEQAGTDEAIGALAAQLREAVPVPALPAALAEPVPSEPFPVELARNETTEMHRITVQHKVPRSILDVVRTQFEVMEGWMSPLLSTAKENSAGITQLRNSVDECLRSYALLLSELESAKPLKKAKKTTKKKRS
ncbi:MAG: AAA family ATPase, partial [Pirellulaceae bacterium]|nr:AAA family ATPase [Pirellulaceae bacterium]